MKILHTMQFQILSYTHNVMQHQHQAGLYSRACQD